MPVTHVSKRLAAMAALPLAGVVLAALLSGAARAATDQQTPPPSATATLRAPAADSPATQLADLAGHLARLAPVTGDVTAEVPGAPLEIASELRQRLSGAGWTPVPAPADSIPAPGVPTMIVCRSSGDVHLSSVAITVSVSARPGASAVRLVVPALRADGTPACGPRTDPPPAPTAGAGLIRDVGVMILCEPRRFPYLAMRVETRQVAGVEARLFQPNGDIIMAGGKNGQQSPLLEFPQIYPPEGLGPTGSTISVCDLPPGTQIPWTITARTALLEDTREGVITR